MARGSEGGGGGGGAINRGTAIVRGNRVHMNCHVDSQFQNKIVLRQVSDCVSLWIIVVTLLTDLFGAFARNVPIGIGRRARRNGCFRRQREV